MDMRERVGRVAVVLVMLGAYGCDSDGGGDDPSGRSTITGTVVEFPDVPVAGGVGEAGVQVGVAGTELETTTDAQGFFILSGVPGGVQQVVFSRGGFGRSTDADVPEHGTVVMNGVRVDDRGVDVDDVDTDVADDSNDDHVIRHSDDDPSEESHDDGPNHDVGDDHGVDGPDHDVGDDHGGDRPDGDSDDSNDSDDDSDDHGGNSGKG